MSSSLQPNSVTNRSGYPETKTTDEEVVDLLGDILEQLRVMNFYNAIAHNVDVEPDNIGVR